MPFILNSHFSALALVGFAQELRDALDQRVDILTELGLAQRRNQRVMRARNLLETLRARDIENRAEKIQLEIGAPHRPAVDGSRVIGT